MNYRTVKIVTLIISFLAIASHTVFAQTEKKFNKKKDLLLANYDCKTDVDDLHSIAALYTILADPAFSKINYRAVAGTYGIQKGLYVPPNELFKLTFKNRWSDAHADFEQTLKEIFRIVKTTLANDGDVWIAEAGQSDFSAALVKRVMEEMPGIKVSKRIHIVQHSGWNEDVTTPESLEFVKKNTDYIKIADGNVEENGSPGFRTSDFKDWKVYLRNPELINVWQQAIKLANQYNRKEGRYNNEAVSNGGLDFSDTAEICHILDIENIRNTTDFFLRFGR
ncbi:MAG: hypothetical protein ACK5M7_05310 [Draconibacterium sp.]